MKTVKQWEVRIVQFDSMEQLKKSLGVLKSCGWKFDKWYGNIEKPYLRIEREVELGG